MKIDAEVCGMERHIVIRDEEESKLLMKLVVSGDTSNCKLSYIHRAGDLILLKSDEDRKAALDVALSYSKGCIIFNTIKEDIVKLIKKNYPYYYCQKVPIGYSNGFQYHICIKNTIKRNQYCRNPIKRGRKKKV